MIWHVCKAVVERTDLFVMSVMDRRANQNTNVFNTRQKLNHKKKGQIQLFGPWERPLFLNGANSSIGQNPQNTEYIFMIK